MTGADVVLPPRLPVTVGERRVSVQLIRPGAGVWRVWLVDGATELAFDAQQVIGFLSLTGDELLDRYPIDWWHEYFKPREVEPTRVLLWRTASVLGAAREFSPLALGDLVQHDRVDAFIEWVSEQHRGLCVEDPQRTLDEALPSGHGGDGEEFPVAAAARRLAVRYGPGVTRAKLFALMERAGWVGRTGNPQGPWKVALPARSRELVFARLVHHPKGFYEQVFLTQAGMSALAEQLRAEVEQPLVDLGEEAGR